ncbi:hypothetical protein [Saccharopolyspora gloriosae]|uniref:hypothetical protein n=1 Tax=Saccharopolyspora gloriosae TaxID=455344 RepID=UPI001FB671EA|nr:hypothetical protein [Saccharopolyspora gloriosae]
MRFRPTIIILRLCGASGIGVLLGLASTGLLSVTLGWTRLDPAWLIGTPVLAVIGAVFGLVAAILTRLWLAPHTARRKLWGAAIGAVAVPLACSNTYGNPPFPLAVAAVLLSAGVIIVLWIRGFRWETALVRQYWQAR